MQMPKDIKKVLVIGSGPIVIGQAAEFDYAGTQACMTLKEAGKEIILINNNPATIMTDEAVADHVYFEPLTLDSLEKIILKHQPDAILGSVSGQTGLNLLFDLDQANLLEKYNLSVLGTQIDAIKQGEDRELFRALMHEINEPVPDSKIISTLDEAREFSDKVGYPIIIRPAYTLGGSGGGIANNEAAFETLVASGLRASPINQCLIERSISGWKEIEMEVIRDASGDTVVVCHMENIDPVGIHTGDALVVAPVQTLSETDLNMLKSASKKIVNAIGIVGACNVQLAIDPLSQDYFIIEINPRVSRSSALASKATGYPIAKVATRLSLGESLKDIYYPKKAVTLANYEPELDYVIVKFPRFAFDKFKLADRLLGTQMKATGEIMAIGETFIQALHKGIRSLELDLTGFYLTELVHEPIEKIKKLVYRADDRRFFAILEAFRRGIDSETIEDATKINSYFLTVMQQLVKLDLALTNKKSLTKADLLTYKQAGFLNHDLAKKQGLSLSELTALLDQHGIMPVKKEISAVTTGEDTASYYYTSWHESVKASVIKEKETVLIIGSGPIRIGQGVEFDYCSVHSVLSLKEAGYETVLVNNNPSTVSTDFAYADKLYFEPMTYEDILHVIELERVDRVLVQYGGQTAINLVNQLEAHKIELLGTSKQTVDSYEDRDRFYDLMKRIKLPHIPGETVYSEADLRAHIEAYTYPVLLRPSYVIGGQGMLVLNNQKELEAYLAKVSKTNIYPILIDAYYAGREIEVDVLSDGRDVFIPAIFELIEEAGVHSGDSMAVTPPVTLSDEIKEAVLASAKLLAQETNYKGIFNIQFVDYENELYVLEVNPRASRTVPLTSKITGINLIEKSVKLLLGKSLNELNLKAGCLAKRSFYTIKAPVFSTHKLPGVDPVLVPEMKSTGELIAVAKSYEQAIEKAFHYNEAERAKFQQTKKEIYLVGDSPLTDELINALNEQGIKHVRESEIEFKKWVKQETAFAVFSTGKSNEREMALKYNLLIFSNINTLKMYVQMKSVNEEVKTVQIMNKEGVRHDL